MRFWALGIGAFHVFQLGNFAGQRLITERDILDRATILSARGDDLLHLKWCGIETRQWPVDAWMIQEIICEQRPDFVVETGTLWGGSAALYASILQRVNPAGKVITIDIVDEAQKNKIPPDLLERIEFIIGSSTDPQVVSRVKEEVGTKKVLVTLDSDHRAEHVLKELQAYQSLIKPGEYLIVQDTNLSGHPRPIEPFPGPWEGMKAFLKSNPEFQNDAHRERFGITMNPGGWLKRIG